MKSARFFDAQSTAFASPSDILVRQGRRERAAQFGLTDEHEESFELNQSFPRLNARSALVLSNALTPDMFRMRGCELGSLSLDARMKKRLLNETVYSSSTSQLTDSSSKNWLFYNQFVNTRALLNAASSPDLQIVSNPNKAVAVINGRTSEVLTANDVACTLFGVESLAGRSLRDLLVVDDEAAEPAEMLMDSDRLDTQGKAVLCAGKIFDALVACDSTRMPVSVYIVKLTDEADPRCLCVMEPIQRVSGTFTVNLKGRIRACNPSFCYIFGYMLNAPGDSSAHVSLNSPRPLASLSAHSLLVGKDIADLIPNIKLPIGAIQHDIRKQSLTGRTCQGENIPVTVTVLKKKLFNNEGSYFSFFLTTLKQTFLYFSLKTYLFKLLISVFYTEINLLNRIFYFNVLINVF